jgi:CubicO group peptidase (beta-lactamase class C family)
LNAFFVNVAVVALRRLSLAVVSVCAATVVAQNVAASDIQSARPSHPAQPAHAAHNASIARIESGLLPARATLDTQPMRLLDRMKHHKTPAISIAVIDNGRVAWARAYGVADAESNAAVDVTTQFQAASVSKSVTAVAALRLVEKKALTLDGNVNDHLVAWKVPDNEFTVNEKVTLRRILAHRAGLSTSGFWGYASTDAIPTVLQVLDGAKPANSEPVRVIKTPQSESMYSGGGFTVLQQMISEAHGKPFALALDDLVLRDAGMTHSTFALPTAQSPRTIASGFANGTTLAGRYRIHPELAAAGLWSTPTDLAQWAIEIANAAAGKSTRVLSQSMAQQMLTSQAGDEWGLGIMLEGRSTASRFSHRGANVGYRSFLVAYKDGSKGAVIMTNSDSGFALIEEVMRAIAIEYQWPGYMPPLRNVKAVSAAALTVLAGDFGDVAEASARADANANANAHTTANTNTNASAATNATASAVRVSVRVQGDRVYARMRGAWQRMHVGGETTLYFPDEDTQLDFVVSATEANAGRVSGVSAGAETGAETGVKAKAIFVRDNGGAAVRLERAQHIVKFAPTVPLFLRGSMNDWGTTQRMQRAGENAWGTTLTLAAGRHEFKIASQDYQQVDIGVLPDSPGVNPGEATALVAIGQNIVFHAAQAGDYHVMLQGNDANALTVTISAK